MSGRVSRLLAIAQGDWKKRKSAKWCVIFLRVANLRLGIALDGSALHFNGSVDMAWGDVTGAKQEETGAPDCETGAPVFLGGSGSLVASAPAGAARHKEVVVS